MIKLHKNRNLFSNHYLENLLPEDSAWNVDAGLEFEKLKELWDAKREKLPKLNESQLRIHFLDKVFELLGFAIDVEPPVAGAEWAVAPDYALFADESSLDSARKGNYFDKSLCLSEAKRWGRPFDKKLKTEKNFKEIQNPSLQMSRYLWFSGVKWGILTDGRFFRLYEREKSKKLDIYYEIDLEEMFQYGTLEDFKYFYLFFRARAFPAFLDKALKESIDYAITVGDELKKNAYRAVHVLSEGFLKSNDLNKDDIKEIYDNTLILLYRLLFTLYAEYRGLLPVDENKLYKESYSLYSIKRDIADRFDRGVAIPTATFNYWNALKGLFETINIGNDELGVPPYNGGLFSPDKYKFLEKHRIGGHYIAKAIDLLSRTSNKEFIDYGTLQIRHLGSIYEGLLEYQLKVTDEDIYPVKEKKGEVYIPLKEAQKRVKKINEIEVVKKGELYLATDKGERKATGSYYTPDYIVEYIVENTLGPVVEEKKTKVDKEITELKEKIKKTRGKPRELLEKQLPKTEARLIEELLTTKVLDPAMGSGHFLVEATDFLATALIDALGQSPETVQEDEARWARREVVEKCIFGVDLNPLAVELAKLSLWLHTVSKNRPLSFLDHHLRSGNSLIGANISDLGALPELNKKKSAKEGPVQLGLYETIFREKVNLLLKDFANIEAMPSDTVEQIRQKEKLYADFRHRVFRFQDVADVWMSVYFGNKEIDYDLLLNNLRASDSDWSKAKNNTWARKARQIADEKRFFHWEIEFPEIFFEGHLRKENPGFDCVIGNPPYDVISELEQGKKVEPEKNFFKQVTIYRAAKGSKLNLYRFFIALSLHYLRNDGMHGFIVPMALLADKQAKPLRIFLIDQNCIKKIEAFPQKDNPLNRVFEEAKLSTCLYIIKKANPNTFLVRVHPGKYILEDSKTLSIIPDQIKKFDEDNWSIPAYPSMSDKDFKLALKIKSLSKGNMLKQVAPSKQGEVNLTEHKRFLTDEEDGRLVLRGAHINRYEFHEETKQGAPVYLDMESFLSDHGKDTKAYDFKYMRIGYQRGSAIDNWRRIIATIIERDNFCSDTINYIVRSEQFKLYSVLALLNSSLWEWRFRLTSTNNHVNSYEIDTMPLPSIEFNSSDKDREEFMGKIIQFHEGNNDAAIMNCVIAEISQQRTDTIHDLLAYLAEQMVEMNKKKKQETKGYLTWLMREIGADIEKLTNKTTIKDYHEHRFDKFLEVLKKNKNRISLDPSKRIKQEMLEKHFLESVSKVAPIKEKIKATDKLIDQIVYRLYDLTEEEIRIVEGK